ncbi:MAG: hypothetical protein M3P84_13015 [Chloroflexota bacterium]|nr:hypothetical protein [Chloroflexota bacterium]
MTGSVAGGAAFGRFAGWLSVLAGIAGVGYAVAFVVLKNGPLSALFLTLAPLLAVGGLVAVFDRVRSIEPGFATVALALGAFGSLAASTHGAYDLANVLHPPGASAPDLTDIPFAVDPRGYGTFALTGLALVLLAWLSSRTPDLPGWVSPLGMVLGLFLVITWLARLIVLDATSVLVLLPALVSGLLSPVFFLLLGAWLLGWRR